MDPPSLLRRDTPVRRSFAPLVETYATVPYADIDPSRVAGVVYVVMFGAMFGDAGHGLILLLAGLLLRWGHPVRLARFHAAWPFVVGASLAAIFFGVLYGEFFGPTGVLPVLWLSPMGEPVQLLLAAIGFGAVLLAGAYLLGTVNRWREGGMRAALYAPSGLAGAAVFLGLGAAAAGLYTQRSVMTVVGGALALAGLVLAGIGLFLAAGGGGAAAADSWSWRGRPRDPPRRQSGVVCPPCRFRFDPRRDLRGGVGGDDRPRRARSGLPRCRWIAVRGRQCTRRYAGGTRRGGAGIAAGVLRVVLESL